MPETSQNMDLDEEGVSAMQKLEREMGVILLAWYRQPAEYAKLSEDQAGKLHELEASLNATILAYEPPGSKEASRP